MRLGLGPPARPLRLSSRADEVNALRLLELVPRLAHGPVEFLQPALRVLLPSALVDGPPGALRQPPELPLELVPFHAEQFIATFAFVYSRTKTPEPGAVSEQFPTGVPTSRLSSSAGRS